MKYASPVQSQSPIAKTRAQTNLEDEYEIHETARRSLFWINFSFLLLAAIAFNSRAVGAQSREKLKDLKLANTTITAAQSVAPEAFAPPAGSPQPFKALPAFCRVTGVIKPTSDSEIKSEVWMPVSGWNGKFQGIGNGGFAGSITPEGLAGALARGYAAASTDTGHSGRTLAELINGPSLNIDGLRSEDVGRQSRTIIPAEATATLDLRLVKGITPRTQVERLIAHIKKQGYFRGEAIKELG